MYKQTTLHLLICYRDEGLPVAVIEKREYHELLCGRNVRTGGEGQKWQMTLERVQRSEETMLNAKGQEERPFSVAVIGELRLGVNDCAVGRLYIRIRVTDLYKWIWQWESGGLRIGT